MFDGKKIAVVVPAYNEERLIVKAVSLVPDYVDHVIVVDDASTDDTGGALASGVTREGLEYLRHEFNRGVGGAIVTGYARGLEIGADVIAVMAGDAQMDPSELPVLLKPIVRGAADYAKGDRLSWAGVFRVMPLFRFVGNHVLSVLTRFASGYKNVRDSQCGYTAVSAAALGRLDLEDLYARYGFPNDILAHLHSVGASLAQVTVRPIYAQECSGISLFTALVRVPLVLLRSYLCRRRRESHKRRTLLEAARRA